MVIISKVGRSLLVLVIIGLLASPLWIKFLPNEALLPIINNIPGTEKVLCQYPVNVSGESMSPIVQPGSNLVFDRCYDLSELNEGLLILFKDDSSLRLGIIRHILPTEPPIFKVSGEKSPDRLQDITTTNIVAIEPSIDTSKTKYQAKQDPQTFVIHPDEYLNDLYLAKIPKSSGIENSNLEQTTQFLIDTDKFCFVVEPIKTINEVRLEISDVDSEQIILLGENIIFTTDPQTNINCLDFGKNQGMINLDSGKYSFNFFSNHQLLQSIIFEVN